MVMTSDGTRIQILANWPMSHAKRVTRDNRKNPEYHVVVPIRKLRTDTNCPAEKPWPNHVKTNWPMSHAKRVTRDNRKNPEYHVVVPIRKLRTDTNCPAEKPWPNHVKTKMVITIL